MKTTWITIPVVLVAAIFFLYTSAFAYSASFINSDASNWDHPSTAAMEAHKVEDMLLTTKATIQWSTDQIKWFQNDDVIRQFFPALVYRADASPELRSKLMVSNVPGAKFTRTNATYTEGEEIKLSILNTSKVVENKPYVFYTTWLHPSHGNLICSPYGRQVKY